MSAGLFYIPCFDLNFEINGVIEQFWFRSGITQLL